jgi:hypothetical protein
MTSVAGVVPFTNEQIFLKTVFQTFLRLFFSNIFENAFSKTFGAQTKENTNAPSLVINYPFS